MNGSIFSEKYVKEKLNRLEQINSQKRLKVQQATQAKKPQMSRHEYEKYKKIIFEQNKKSQIPEEKANDSIPTKETLDKSKSQKQMQATSNQQQNNSETLKINKSLDRNRSPKANAGQIVFTKRNSSISKKNSLNHSEILPRSPLVQSQQSPKHQPSQVNQQIKHGNQQQKLKQSKSLMKLSNTMRQNNEMTESQITQEIPNSSRTQHVLQNMKSILSIGSPQAYFSNATSTLEDPALLEQTQFANPLQRFNQGNYRQSQQIYTPAPLSPGNTMLIYHENQHNPINNITPGLYPTYQTQQSVDFMNSDNPEFMQMMRNQHKYMKSSQLSNFNDAEDIYQQTQQDQQQYTHNSANIYQSPQQQNHFFNQNSYQPLQQQQIYYNTFDQKAYQIDQSTHLSQTHQIDQPTNNFVSPRTNQFQRQLQVEDNNNNLRNHHQNGGLKRQLSQPEISSSSSNHIYYQQQQQQLQQDQLQYDQYYQDPQHERKYSNNSYNEKNSHNNNYQNLQQNQQFQQQQQINGQYLRNSQVELDGRHYDEEQEYLQGLSQYGVQDDLNQSEILISQLKQNQTILKQEKEQLERELLDLESKSRAIKSSHKKQQSIQYTDTSSSSSSQLIRTGYLEASFKKQAQVMQHFADEDEFFDVGFEKKWEQIEREEEETEKSFMIISEYLNMQSEQGKGKNFSKQLKKDINISRISSNSNKRKKSEEYDKKHIQKNSDQYIEKLQNQNRQQNGERDDEDMEWLDGIEESFCELKSINKNELMPQYSELKSHKKSYLQKYQQESTSNNNNQNESEDDAYIRLKNQIIGKMNEDSHKFNTTQKAVKSVSSDYLFMKSNGSRESSLKGSNIIEQINSEGNSLTKEIFQESTKGTRSPQFGASGKLTQGFSYLNESNGKDQSYQMILKKDIQIQKGRMGQQSIHEQSQGSHSFVVDNHHHQQQQSKNELKRDTSLVSIYQAKEDHIQKSSSANNLINNFYNDIQEISQKNNEKFHKQDEAIVLSDRNIKKSNEIIDKINNKYQNGNKQQKQNYNLQYEQEYDEYDEDVRQQHYIMKKLNEMQADNTSQTSSLREKDLQYSSTVSSYLPIGGDSQQLKRSATSSLSALNTVNTTEGIHKDGKTSQLYQQSSQSNYNRQDMSNNNALLKNNTRTGYYLNRDNLNEELQVVDLNNYSSFKNELQQSEQQPEEIFEDQYFKLSNNKNSSFEKELNQMQNNLNTDNNNKSNNSNNHMDKFNMNDKQHQQQSQVPSQKSNLFSTLMQNVQKEIGGNTQSTQNSLTSLFSKKLETRMEPFYNEPSQQKSEEVQYNNKIAEKRNKEVEDRNEDKAQLIKRENGNMIARQINKVFQKSDDEDDSQSSGDELEETILSKLQKLKKRRESNSKEKSPLSQNQNIGSDFKSSILNRPLTSSKGDSSECNNNGYYEQINKENNNSNKYNQLKSNSSSLSNSNNNNNNNNEKLQKMQLDELFSKNKQTEQIADETSCNKANSTRDKISSIQQKLNNLFEKKNGQQPTKPQPIDDKNNQSANAYDYPKKSTQNNKQKEMNQNASDEQGNQKQQPRIDRKVIDNLAEEVEMLMKMQNLENQYKEKDSENKQLKQEFINYERHVYEEDGDVIQLDEDIDFSNSYTQSESQKNLFRNKQQLPLYEIEEEHSIDNSIADQNFQIKNQYH